MWCRSRWPLPRRIGPAEGLGPQASASTRPRIREQPKVEAHCTWEPCPFPGCGPDSPGPPPPPASMGSPPFPGSRLSPGDASQIALCSFWLKFLLSCFWFSAHFCLHCLCPTPISHQLTAGASWEQLCSFWQLHSTWTCVCLTLLIFVATATQPDC